MIKCYLDANFIVYLKSENSPQFSTASVKYKSLINKKTELFISPLTIDEFIHAMFFLKRNKKLAKIFDIRRDLQELLDLPRLSLINPPADKKSQLQILDFMEKYNIGPRDAYHLITMFSNSIDAFATFDTDFRKVFSAKLLLRL